MQTISFFYDDHRKVKKVLAELQALGVTSAATTLVARDADEPYRYRSAVDRSEDDAVFGAMIGGVAGILLGALAATGTLEVPGLGPLFAMGQVMTFVTTGSVGALAGWGLGTLMYYLSVTASWPDSGTLLSVQVDDSLAVAVEAIMRKGYTAAHAERIDVPNTTWGHRDSAWSRHDSMAQGIGSIPSSRPPGRNGADNSSGRQAKAHRAA